MHIPPIGLLVRARLFNQLAAKVKLASRHPTEARWECALSGISNREKQLASQFSKGLMDTCALQDQVERLAYMQLIVDTSFRPEHVDASAGISSERVQDAIHLKLLSIRSQLQWQPDGRGATMVASEQVGNLPVIVPPKSRLRREIDQLIKANKPEDCANLDHTSNEIAEGISQHGARCQQSRSKVPASPAMQETSINRSSLPDWHEVSNIFWASEPLHDYEYFKGSVTTAVERILCKAPSRSLTMAEQRCRLTFEVLESIHRHEPQNLSDEWSPNRFLFDSYRSILEGEAVGYLLAERARARTASATWKDSAVWSAGSSAVRSGGMASIVTCGFDNDDDSATWSDGEGDGAQFTYSSAASLLPGRRASPLSTSDC